MSDAANEQLYRIATALETIAKQGEKTDEETIVSSVYNAVATTINSILDETTNEFDLRRQLRKFTQGVLQSNQ